MEKYLLIISVAFNIIGTIILATPFLSVNKDLKDDLLVGGTKKIVNGKEKITYIKAGFLKDRIITLWGLGFLFLGFLIQLFEAILYK
jgi:hypothetical protein